MKITFESTGSSAAELAQQCVQILNSPGHNVETAENHRHSLGAIETLAITVAGTVISHLVTKMVDAIVSRRSPKNDNVKVLLYFVEFNVTFNLPADHGRYSDFLEKQDDSCK